MTWRQRGWTLSLKDVSVLSVLVLRPPLRTEAALETDEIEKTQHSCREVWLCWIVQKHEQESIHSSETLTSPLSQKTVKHCWRVSVGLYNPCGPTPKSRTGRLSQRQWGGLWLVRSFPSISPSVHLSIRPLLTNKIQNSRRKKRKPGLLQPMRVDFYNPTHPDPASQPLPSSLCHFNKMAAETAACLLTEHASQFSCRVKWRLWFFFFSTCK